MSKYTPEQIDKLCQIMHDAYEQAAVEAGWETQSRSRKPWESVPEANKITMRAAVRAMVESIAFSENLAEVKAEAWDEAIEAQLDTQSAVRGITIQIAPNPYREEAK